MILRSLLIVAMPYMCAVTKNPVGYMTKTHACDMTQIHMFDINVHLPLGHTLTAIPPAHRHTYAHPHIHTCEVTQIYSSGMTQIHMCDMTEFHFCGMNAYLPLEN